MGALPSLVLGEWAAAEASSVVAFVLAFAATAGWHNQAAVDSRKVRKSSTSPDHFFLNFLERLAALAALLLVFQRCKAEAYSEDAEAHISNARCGAPSSQFEDQK